jgi:hypothetical protein
LRPPEAEIDADLEAEEREAGALERLILGGAKIYIDERAIYGALVIALRSRGVTAHTMDQ